MAMHASLGGKNPTAAAAKKAFRRRSCFVQMIGNKKEAESVLTLVRGDETEPARKGKEQIVRLPQGMQRRSRSLAKLVLLPHVRRRASPLGHVEPLDGP